MKNPANNSFVYDGSVQISLYDNAGWLVRGQQANIVEGRNIIKLNIGNKETGMYYLRMINMII